MKINTCEVGLRSKGQASSDMTHEPVLRAIPCVWSRQLGSVACCAGDFSKAGTVCMWHSAVFKEEDQYNYLPCHGLHSSQQDNSGKTGLLLLSFNL